MWAKKGRAIEVDTTQARSGLWRKHPQTTNPARKTQLDLSTIASAKHSVARYHCRRTHYSIPRYDSQRNNGSSYLVATCCIAALKSTSDNAVPRRPTSMPMSSWDSDNSVRTVSQARTPFMTLINKGDRYLTTSGAPGRNSDSCSQR